MSPAFTGGLFTIVPPGKPLGNGDTECQRWRDDCILDRPEGAEGVCHMNTQRRNILCRGKSRCKSSKAEVCMEWSENDKKASGSLHGRR